MLLEHVKNLNWAMGKIKRTSQTTLVQACTMNTCKFCDFEFVKRITGVIVLGMEEWREGKYGLWLNQGKYLIIVYYTCLIIG